MTFQVKVSIKRRTVEKASHLLIVISGCSKLQEGQRETCLTSLVGRAKAAGIVISEIITNKDSSTNTIFKNYDLP